MLKADNQLTFASEFVISKKENKKKKKQGRGKGSFLKRYWLHSVRSLFILLFKAPGHSFLKNIYANRKDTMFNF